MGEHILDLTPDILLDTWPEQRVVVGRRVCWKLAKVLSAASRVVFSRRADFDLRGQHQISFKAFQGQVFLAVSGIPAYRTFLADLQGAIFRDQPLIVSLNLNGNELGDDATAGMLLHLPSASNLTSLSLAFNQLSDVGVTSLAKHLSRSSSALRQLDLGCNEIGSEGVKHLTIGLNQHSSLSSLSLADNCMQSNAGHCLADLLSLPLRANLTHLNVEGNDLKQPGARDMAEALSFCTSLTFLSVRGNDIGADGAECIACRALGSNFQLSELDLADNNLGDDGVEALARALDLERVPLRALDLSANRIESAGATCLGRWLRPCSTLARCSLRSNKLCDQGVAALAPWLRNAHGLRHLSLPAVAMSAVGLQALACSLDGNNGAKLTHLDVSEQPLDAVGAGLLANSVSRWPCLKTLRMASCAISDGGATALARGLEAAGGLEELDLADNQLSAASGPVLGRALVANAGLVWVRLSDNGLGDGGVRDCVTSVCAIASEAPLLSLLETLGLSRCDIGDVGAASLAALITRPGCPRLSSLDLRGNEIYSAAAAILAAAGHEQGEGARPARRGKVDIDLARNPCMESRSGGNGLGAHGGNIGAEQRNECVLL